MTREGMRALMAAEAARDRRKKAIQAGASDVLVAKHLMAEAAAVTEAAAVVARGAKS